ncbi:MAG: SIS domain-containing protein [Betaproteobacteria bacterium]|jgi:D-sedoheptulose 7-phosphate isomerase|nr:SIS domain-containing protein [Betaproteobacteria bacterium]
MLEHRIEQQFIDSADLKYQVAQILSKPMVAAVQSILVCVTGGGKVLACGNGGCAALAQLFAATFVSRYERERPELGAIALNTDGVLLTAAALGYGLDQVFAKQLRALGQPGDVLLVLSVGEQAENLLEAIRAAHERELSVVAITGQSSGKIRQLLHETDVHICVPSDKAARLQEVYLLVLHGLCDGVDSQLLGEQENNE